MSEPADVDAVEGDEPAVAMGPPITMGPQAAPNPGAPAEPPALPEGVLAVRVGPGANCSSAGSTIDILFFGSAIVGAIAVALAAAFPPRAPRDDDEGGDRDDAAGTGTPG